MREWRNRVFNKRAFQAIGNEHSSEPKAVSDRSNSKFSRGFMALVIREARLFAGRLRISVRNRSSLQNTSAQYLAAQNVAKQYLEIVDEQKVLWVVSRRLSFCGWSAQVACGFVCSFSKRFPV